MLQSNICASFGCGSPQMMTVYAMTYALLAPIIAALAAHVPRKQLLLGGLAVFVFANLGTAMFGPTATGSATLIVPPERRGFAISVLIASMVSASNP
jgi:DHA1 family inner membrane transport protein